MPDVPSFQKSAIPGERLQDALQKTFGEAIKEHAATILTRAEDWADYAVLEDRHEAARDDLEDAYRTTYSDRVETTRAALYEEAGQKSFDHPGPWGLGRTDDQITTQAHRIVQAAHRGDQDRLERAQTKDLSDFLDARRAPEGPASPDRSRDRDHRAPTRSQD